MIACAKRQKKKHALSVKRISVVKPLNRLSVMQRQRHRLKLMLLHAVNLKPELQLNAQSAKKLKPRRKQSVKQKPLLKKLSRKRTLLSQRSAAVRRKLNQRAWLSRSALRKKKRAGPLIKSTAVASIDRLSQT